MKLFVNLVRFSLFSAAIALAVISGVGEFGRIFATADILNHFRPFTMIAAIALLAIVMVAYPRPLRRQAAVWLTLFTIALQGLSLGPELAKSAISKAIAAPHPMVRKDVLRIATLNVWGRNNKHSEAVDALLALDPDVIVLQEMWHGQEPFLSLLKKSYPFTSECVAVSLCNVAILSRAPMRHAKIYRPQKHLGIGDWTVPVVRADLDLRKADKSFDATIFATHLTWPTQVPLQQTQMEQLAGAVKSAKLSNVVVLGDFNSTPWSFGLQYLGDLLQLRRVTLALPTWPSNLAPRILSVFRNGLARYGLRPTPFYAPFLPIDHAFIGDNLDARSVNRARIPGSDHYAVVIDIEAKR